MLNPAFSGEDRLRAVLYLNGLRGPDIDDALQEVRTRTMVRPPRDARAVQRWQVVVAVNLALDRHRAVKREAETIAKMRSMPQPTAPSADQTVVLREIVERGLAVLDPEMRAVVVLRFYEDRTLEEIAEALGVPLGTVKSRLHRAIAQLRAALPREEVHHGS